MLRLLLIASLIISVSSCVTTSNVPADVAHDIPKGATAVVVHSQVSPAELYRSIHRQLASTGYEVTEHNDEMGTLSTGYRDAGQETMVKAIVYVSDDPGGSTATIRGQWTVSGSFASSLGAGLGVAVSNGANPAKWSMGRPAVAFGELVTLAKLLPQVRVEYLTE